MVIFDYQYLILKCSFPYSRPYHHKFKKWGSVANAEKNQLQRSESVIFIFLLRIFVICANASNANRYGGCFSAE
jgi:hypothetical protein